MSTFNNVYFRINTPSYYNSKYGVGWTTPEDGKLFQKTITDLFLNNGWEIKKERYNGGCNTIIKDNQELYLHPQSISGVVIEYNIPVIEQLLNTELFKHYHTDICEEIFDITNEEYINMLKSKQSEIEKDILATFKTKRKNLFITSSWTSLQSVLSKYRIKRLLSYSEVRSSNELDFQYIAELFENLVTENKIITANTKHGTGYRSVA